MYKKFLLLSLFFLFSNIYSAEESQLSSKSRKITIEQTKIFSESEDPEGDLNSLETESQRINYLNTQSFYNWFTSYEYKIDNITIKKVCETSKPKMVVNLDDIVYSYLNLSSGKSFTGDQAKDEFDRLKSEFDALPSTRQGINEEFHDDGKSMKKIETRFKNE